jgi:hypothetical protein
MGKLTMNKILLILAFLVFSFPAWTQTLTAGQIVNTYPDGTCIPNTPHCTMNSSNTSPAWSGLTGGKLAYLVLEVHNIGAVNTSITCINEGTSCSGSGDTSWVILSGCQGYNSGPAAGLACAYNLNDTAATSLTVNYTNNSTAVVKLSVAEVGASFGNWSYLTTTSANLNSSSTTQPGQSLTWSVATPVVQFESMVGGAGNQTPCSPYNSYYITAGDHFGNAMWLNATTGSVSSCGSSFWTAGGTASTGFGSASAFTVIVSQGAINGVQNQTVSANQFMGVPFCVGFTATAGQAVEYSTSLTPNPCWTAATPGSGMVYPGAGIPVSVSGTSWGTSLTEFGSEAGVATSADPGTTVNVPMVADGSHGQKPSPSGALGTGAFAAAYTLPSATSSVLGGVELNTDLGGTATAPNVVGLRGLTLPTLASATGLFYDNAGTLALDATLPTAAEPAHTGDVTNTAGSLAMTIAANAVTLAKQATNTANTLQGFNNSGAAADVAVGAGCTLSAGTLSCAGTGGTSNLRYLSIQTLAGTPYSASQTLWAMQMSDTPQLDAGCTDGSGHNSHASFLQGTTPVAGSSNWVANINRTTGGSTSSIGTITFLEGAITNVAGSGTVATYTVSTMSAAFATGQIINITGLTHTAFNCTDCTVLSGATTTSFTVSNTNSLSSSSDTGVTAAVYGNFACTATTFADGDFMTLTAPSTVDTNASGFTATVMIVQD